MVSLQFHGKYGYKTPLGQIDLELRRGEYIGVSGVNGSGKSTLLKTLGGQIDPLEGVPVIDKVPTSSKQALALIKSIDAPSFLPDLTIQEHFELVFKGKENTQRIQTQKWRLEEILDFPPSWLSSGQKQRAFLALHVHENWNFILLDEPERHLDKGWIGFLSEELNAIASLGVGIVVASHNERLLNSCDRAIEL